MAATIRPSVRDLGLLLEKIGIAVSMTMASTIRPSVRVLATVLLLALFLSNPGCQCKELNLQSSHLSFLKANYNSRGRKPRNMWCANDPGACSRFAPEGSTSACCLNRYCVDLSSDSHHCGSCGLARGYGLSCCGRTCVDLNNDKAHCGACFNACPYEETCSFGMCGYGYSKIVHSEPGL